MGSDRLSFSIHCVSMFFIAVVLSMLSDWKSFHSIRSHFCGQLKSSSNTVQSKKSPVCELVVFRAANKSGSQVEVETVRCISLLISALSSSHLSSFHV